MWGVTTQHNTERTQAGNDIEKSTWKESTQLLTASDVLRPHSTTHILSLSPWCALIAVSGPTMAIIALHCPHIKVIVADINKKQIEKWNSG